MARILNIFDKKKAPPAADNHWLSIQKVCRAIVTIHGSGQYYEGMDLLCEVVGWPPIIREVDSAEKMNGWLKKFNAGLLKDRSCVDEIVNERAAMDKPNQKFKKCDGCNRFFIIGKRYFKKANRPYCNSCGRQFYERRAGR